VNKKGISTLVIVAIIVIAVVVVGIAAYYVWTGEEGEPTPTPTPTPTPNPVEGATSMRFDVVVNFEGDLLETDLFTVKNLGTSDVLLRVDQTDKDGLSFIYLMSQTSQSAWANAMDTGFIDDSENFATYWDSTLIGKPAVDGYMGALANWSGTGDYEFSSGDYSYVISNVVVDPDIPDSAFEPA
jgi:hypothetical protein